MEKEIKLTMSFSKEKVKYGNDFGPKSFERPVKEENIGFIKMNDVVIFKKSVYDLEPADAEVYLLESFSKHIEPYSPIKIVS